MSTCEILDQVPSTAKKIGEFRHTGGFSREEITGGQVIYLRFQNNTVFVTGGDLKIRWGNPVQEDCSAKISVLPRSTATYRSGGVFTGGAVQWFVDLRTEADVVDLFVEVYSTN